jgi:uncharacterized membrane protein
MALPSEAERYLKELGQGLASLPPTERAEILAELRAHLAERAARGGAPLAGFEPAETLAASFLSERALRGALAQGGAVALGRALLAAGRESVLALLGFLPLLLLQLAGLVCLAVAVLKPFMADRVGLWVGPGNFHVGVNVAGRPELHEVLGWWGIPVLAVTGALLSWASTRAMRALARRRLAAIRTAFP